MFLFYILLFLAYDTFLYPCFETKHNAETSGVVNNAYYAKFLGFRVAGDGLEQEICGDAELSKNVNEIID